MKKTSKKQDAESIKRRQEANQRKQEAKEFWKTLCTYLDGHVYDRDAIQLRPNTCVRIKVMFKGISEVSIGFSKVQWPDEWSAELGVRIATNKAIERLAHEIMERDPSHARLIVEQVQKHGDKNPFAVEYTATPVSTPA